MTNLQYKVHPSLYFACTEMANFIAKAKLILCLARRIEIFFKTKVFFYNFVAISGDILCMLDLKTFVGVEKVSRAAEKFMAR